MKKLTTALCTLTAVLMLGASLTGCGDSSSTADNSTAEISQTEPESSDEQEESVVETEIITTEAEDSVSDEDKKAAEEAVRKFMDAMIAGDADGFIEASNYCDAMHFYQEDMSDEEIRQSIADMLGGNENALNITYEIGEVKTDSERFHSYNENVQKVLDKAEDELKDSEDETEQQMYQLITSLLHPLDKLLYVELTITENDEPQSDEMPVLYVDGKWRVDMGLMDMINYLNFDYGPYEANAAAKSASNAFNSALLDMDTEDLGINKLDGTIYFKGSDFDIEKPEQLPKDLDDLKKELAYRTALYYSDITKLEQIAVQISDGMATAIAIYNGERYGTYPYQLTEDATVSSIDDALTYVTETDEIAAPADSSSAANSSSAAE